jgi:hypothetical protein
MNDHDEKQIASGVDKTLNRLDTYVVKNLPKEQREILEKQKVEKEVWTDFAALAKAMRDPRVQNLGREAFHVIRNSSVFDGPAKLSGKIVQHLTPRLAELNALREELVPKGFTRALDRWREDNMANLSYGFGSYGQPEVGVFPEGKYAEGSDQEGSDHIHSKAWRGMLNPSITKLLRSNSSSTIEIEYTDDNELSIESVPTKERRLNMGTWARPVLTGFENSIGITATVLVTAMEIIIHVEIITPKFHMPTWAWMSIVVPSETVGVWTCVTGLSVWCDIMFGALGLNVLDAFYVLIRMR